MWYVIIATEYCATLRHKTGLVLCLINLIVYFFRFKWGIFLTGGMLILSTLNFLAFFPDIASSSFFIKIGGKRFETPSIQGKSLLLLINYFIFNTRYLIDLYSDYKHTKHPK
jgi:hypothetical protein